MKEEKVKSNLKQSNFNEGIVSFNNVLIYNNINKPSMNELDISSNRSSNEMIDE